MTRINQPDMVCAILGELERQQPGISCNPELFALICQAADKIVAAANANPAPAPDPDHHPV